MRNERDKPPRPPVKGVDSQGAPGTVRGRAGTAGTFGANVARADRDPDRVDEGETLGPEPEGDEEGQGLAGSGGDLSGTIPGSVGGTTGVGGENAGLRSPGATDPGFPGISPEEAERLRRRGRKS